jgi:peptidoglycan/xylan/chitin deacetylase (PgdA/CDA1 family)
MKKPKVLSVFWHNVTGNSAPCDSAEPTVALFREQIAFLVRNYAPIPVSEFLRICKDNHLAYSYRKPPLLVGFDDGFKNVIRYALPVLEEFKVPAVLFVIGEILRNPNFVPWYVERKHLIRKAAVKTIVYGNTKLNLSLPQDRMKLKHMADISFKSCDSEPDRQRLLSSLAAMLDVARPTGADLDEDLHFVDGKDLAALSSSPLITIASHAMTHRDLTTLSYREQVQELEESDVLLRQHCPSYHPVIAYPNGSFNKDTLAIATRIYKAGFAVLLGSSYRNSYAYPRVGIGYNTVQELAYAISPKRLKWILPVKRFLHTTGVRPLGQSADATMRRAIS